MCPRLNLCSIDEEEDEPATGEAGAEGGRQGPLQASKKASSASISTKGDMIGTAKVRPCGLTVCECDFFFWLIVWLVDCLVG